MASLTTMLQRLAAAPRTRNTITRVHGPDGTIRTTVTRDHGRDNIPHGSRSGLRVRQLPKTAVISGTLSKPTITTMTGPSPATSVPVIAPESSSNYTSPSPAMEETRETDPGVIDSMVEPDGTVIEKAKPNWLLIGGIAAAAYLVFFR